MASKYTVDDVINVCKKLELELVSTNFTGVHSSVTFKCPKHPDKVFKSSFAKLRNRKRKGCKYCIGLGKHSYEDVRLNMLKKGFILLSKEYRNLDQILEYECIRHPGAVHRTSYSNIKNKIHGCPLCSNSMLSDKFITPYDQVRDDFAKRGYTLLDTEYKSPEKKLRFRCPQHPDKTTSILYSSLKAGHGCAYCAGSAKYTIDEVKNALAKKDLILVDDNYNGVFSKIRYKCKKHPNKILTATFKYLNKPDSIGCRICSKRIIPDIESVRNEFAKKNFTLLSDEYVTAKSKLYFMCDKHTGIIQHTTFDNIKNCEIGCAMCIRDNYRGENNPQWKGGISNINQYFRYAIKPWSDLILEKYRYTCFITGEVSKKGMNVHHIEPFNKIRDRVISQLQLDFKKHVGDYTSDEIRLIAERIKEIHKDLDGIPMKKDVHKLFHKIFGNENNNLEQVILFKEMYCSHKNLIANYSMCFHS